MPYLEYLFCEHCGDYAKLDIDMAATINAYREDGREKVAIVQPTLIWDYMVYSCGICGKKHKYTYRDVERRVREYFSSFSQEFKEYFDGVVANAEGEDAAPLPPEERPVARRDAYYQQVAGRVRERYTAKKE